jgi:hypothetical protein
MIRKVHVLPSIEPISELEPVARTIAHMKINTTMVRRAVATVESMSLRPHLASMEVNPAKNAEPTAYRIHTETLCFAYIYNSRNPEKIPDRFLQFDDTEGNRARDCAIPRRHTWILNVFEGGIAP